MPLPHSLTSLTSRLALATLAVSACVCAPSRACAAMGTAELLARYQEVYQRAEGALTQGGLLEAIRIYEESLSALDGYGGVHLRLAQLYQQRVDETATPGIAAELLPFAAFHFLRCAQDGRFDALMRETVCEPEVSQRLSPLLLKGNPARVEVYAPRPFIGEARTGALLPVGEVQLRAQLTQGSEPVDIRAQLPLREPLDLSEEAFMPARPRLDFGEGLVAAPPPLAPAFNEPPPHPAAQRSRVPGAVMLGVGAALTAFGGVKKYQNTQNVNNPANQMRCFGNTLGSECPTLILGVGIALAVFGSGWLAFAW